MGRNLVFTLLTAFLLTACVGTTSNSPWKSQSNSAPSTATTGAPLSADGTGAANGQTPADNSGLPAVKAKVAILLPLSGRGKDTGEAMLNAAQLAMFDLGATDLFELVPKDTGSGATMAAQDALQNGSGLILGPLFSDDTKSVAPLATQKGVATVSFSTDTTAAIGTTFLMGFVPQSQIEQIVDFAASRGLRRIAVIAPRDTYGDAVAASFYSHMQLRGLTNGGVIRYDAASVPDAVQLADLKRAPLDAVLIGAAGTKAAQISAALSAQGMTTQIVKRLGTGLWDDPATTSRPELQGAWYAASSPVMRSRFERRYLETYGVTPPRLASLAYDATALAVVLSKTGKGYGRSALTSPSGFAGIDGIFRFRADGMADRGLAILEIQNNQGLVLQNAPTSFVSARK